MPTFDFRCLSCQAVFEHTVPFGKKSIPACPSCGKKKTEKLLAPPAVVFKGAGWYKTDSRPAEKTAKPDTKSPTETAQPDATPASDTKPKSVPAKTSAPAESTPARTETKKKS